MSSLHGQDFLNIWKWIIIDFLYALEFSELWNKMGMVYMYIAYFPIIVDYGSDWP